MTDTDYIRILAALDLNVYATLKGPQQRPKHEA